MTLTHTEHANRVRETLNGFGKALDSVNELEKRLNTGQVRAAALILAIQKGHEHEINKTLDLLDAWVSEY